MAHTGLDNVNNPWMSTIPCRGLLSQNERYYHFFSRFEVNIKSQNVSTEYSFLQQGEPPNPIMEPGPALNRAAVRWDTIHNTIYAPRY